MFKNNNEDNRTKSMTSFSCLYCQLWTHFTSFTSASIVNFEQVGVDWATSFIDFFNN